LPLGARQLQVLTQQIEQCGTHINGDFMLAAVDAQRDCQKRTKFHVLTSPAVRKQSRQTEHAGLSAHKWDVSARRIFAQNRSRRARIIQSPCRISSTDAGGA
jgi:hypothetical protein